MPAVPLLRTSARLAARRMRTRMLSVAATTVGLTVAAGLIAWSSFVAARAQEQNVRVQLHGLSAQDRTLRITYYRLAGEPDRHGRAVAAAARRLRSLGGPERQVTVWHPVAPQSIDEQGTTFVVPREPAADAALLTGRFPRVPCGARVCEALALAGPYRVGERVRVGKVTVRIVGTGVMRPVALQADVPIGDESLLVRGITNPWLRDELVTQSGMSRITTIPLDASHVDAGGLGRYVDRLRTVVVALNRSSSDNLVVASAPVGFLEQLRDRGNVARTRLLLVAGQAAALIVAFAAYAATARRRDVELLRDQLSHLGARLPQVLVAGTTEILVPALVALALVLGGAWAAAEIESSNGHPGFVGLALSPATIVTVVGVVVAGMAALVLSARRPWRHRLGFGPFEAAALGALGLFAWQMATTGALDPAQVSSGTPSPVLLLLPSLAFFATAVLLLRVMPLLLRLGERLSRRAPTGVQLAFVSAARRPAQAAAATTFLAVALGTAIASAGYRATLTDQAKDQAAFAAGAEWRVLELSTRTQTIRNVGAPPSQISSPVSRPSTGISSLVSPAPGDVAPLTRYAAVTDEPPTPVLHLQATQVDVSANPTDFGIPVSLLGVPASRLPELRGWRHDFSSLSLGDLARRLRTPAKLHGLPIRRDATSLRARVYVRGKTATAVILSFLLPGQDFATARLGVALPNQWTLLRLPVPKSLRGAEVIDLELLPTGVPSDFGTRGFRDVDLVGPFEERVAGGWRSIGVVKGWRSPRDDVGHQGLVEVTRLASGPVRTATRFSMNGTQVPALQPRVGVPAALPVLASPDVAARAAHGEVTFDYYGQRIRGRIVGTAKLFPTVTSDTSEFVVADYDTLFAALNIDRPGAAPPTEAWFFEPKPPAFAARLATTPFKVDRVVAEQQEAKALLDDSLSVGTRQVLLVAAVAGALLALLGLVVAMRTALTDEQGVFAEYEALGVSPRALVRSSVLRLAALSVAGVAAGAVGGFLALRLIGAFLAVTANGTAPLPPIEAVVPWAVIVALVAGVGLASIAAAAFVARRVLATSAAMRLRT